VAGELAALRKVNAAREAYSANRRGVALETADLSHVLGSPTDALLHISQQARAFEVLLGADAFAEMGLPAYNLVSLDPQP
jgi:hypothetical protein